MKKFLIAAILLLVCICIAWVHIELWSYGLAHSQQATFAEEIFID